jgi:hypothetical protein
MYWKYKLAKTAILSFHRQVPPKVGTIPAGKLRYMNCPYKLRTAIFAPFMIIFLHPSTFSAVIENIKYFYPVDKVSIKYRTKGVAMNTI